jgi:pyruvate formate lyase activating enzyme
MKITFKGFLVTAFVLVNVVYSSPPASCAQPAKEALFYEKLSSKDLRCLLCPRECVIAPGKRGFCRVRQNSGGILYTLSYGKPVAMHIDPIEKKPLFNFLPGTSAFSIACAGCNLTCQFCQNWEISQSSPDRMSGSYIEPEELLKKIKDSGIPTVAYTYTEPTIFYEYILELSKLARAAGVRVVMHSNGYINEKPLRDLAKYLDAANIDLKGFSDDYYARIAQGSLAPVLKTLRILKEEGVHLEITNLVLPGYNDDLAVIKKMCEWIRDNLGTDTPLHFTRFYPMYKLVALTPTPVETLEKARDIAMACGLKYVYIGNVPGHDGENTYCPKCGRIVIKRMGYMVSGNNLKAGACGFCGEKISGVWQ